jgi:DNA-binding transcriptional ArsR family regulator
MRNNEYFLDQKELLTIKIAQLNLRAISHDLRQRILKLLQEKKEMTVTEIYVKLRLEQSVTSSHLKILREAKIVKARRDGKTVFYSVNKERIDELVEVSQQMNLANGR